MSVNRVVPSVRTKVVNLVSASVQPTSDVIAMVGPANGGAVDEVLSYNVPATALSELGACRMTNQMFAAWAGGAGTIKVVRAGGTKTFNDVLYLDNDSPDATTYDITTYMSRRNATSNLDDFYASISGQLSPGYGDQFGEDATATGDVIIFGSSEKFETCDLVFATAPSSGMQIEVAYYTGDVTQTFNGLTGWTTLAPFSVDGVERLDGLVNIGGLTSPSLEWDLADVPDWTETTLTDSDSTEHSGFYIAIRCSDAISPSGEAINIARICQRVGAEAPWAALYPGTFDTASPDVTGYLNGHDTALDQVIMFEGKEASEDTIAIQFKLVGAKVYVTVTRTDSAGAVTTENYTINPSVQTSPDQIYIYSTEDFITEVNDVSTIITVTDLSESNTMFGWDVGVDGTTKTVTLAGGNNNDDDLSLKDYARAISLLRKESDVEWVVPVITEETLYKDGTTAIDNDKFLAIMTLFATDVNNLASGLNQKFRILSTWLSPGYQNVGTISNANNNIKSGSGKRLSGSSRYIYTIDKLGFPELEGDGSLGYRREYLASYTIGKLSSLEPAVPGTRKTLTVGAISNTYDFDEMDVLIRNGVLAYSNIDGLGVAIGKAVTTLTDGSILAAISARRVADRIAKESTIILERRYIGRALETGVTEEIKKDMAAYLRTKIAPAAAGGLIDGFGDLSAVADQSNPNKVFLSYSLDIKTDLDYIDQDIFLTNLNL